MGGLGCAKVVIDYRYLAAQAAALSQLATAHCEALAQYDVIAGAVDTAAEQKVLAFSKEACEFGDEIGERLKSMQDRLAYYIEHAIEEGEKGRASPPAGGLS